MSLLEGTLNTRNILPDSLRYIRSDVPNNLSDEEVDWLIANNKIPMTITSGFGIIFLMSALLFSSSGL